MNTRLLQLLPLLFAYNSILSQPPSNGLVCWFPFNGSSNDASGNGHNGVVLGATLTNDRHETPNAAYHFDGSDDFIFVPDHPDLRLGNTSFTISAWVLADELSDLQAHSVISKRTGSGNLGYLFQLIGSDHIMGLAPGSFDIITSGGWTDPKLTTFTQLTTSEWHLVLYCYDNATGVGQFYVDNQPDIYGPMIAANGIVTGDFYIGKDNLTDGIEMPSIAPDYVGGFYFHGSIDDIRIYNRKLEQYEMDELFNEGISSDYSTKPDVSIVIHPDPVSTILSITTEHAGIQSIAIYDSAGRLHIEKAFSTEVDCSFLQAGSYIISFLDKHKQIIASQKFIKQ